MWENATAILSYGVFGLGFLLAYLGLSAVKSSPENFRVFMTFSITVFSIGAVLQYFTERNRIDSDDFRYTWGAIPDEMFNDYVGFRTKLLFGTRSEGIERFDGYVKVKDEPSLINVSVSGGKCRFFFASSKPPARISTIIANTDTRWKLIGDSGFWQEGIICAPSDQKNHDVQVKISAKRSDGDYVFRLWEALDNDRKANGLFLDEPPKPVQFSKVVCRGEYRENCPVTPDYHIGCLEQDAETMGHNVCATLKVVRFETLVQGISGNRCGYAAYRVTCE